MTTVGVHRHLSLCSDPAGFFCILAIDHRDNLIAELQKHAAAPVTFEDVVRFKQDVIGIAAGATAVLTDPDYGMAALTQDAALQRLGRLAPLEVTDYKPHPSQRKPRLIPDWDADKLQRAGFNGAKLLVFFHPDAADAAEKTALVDRLAVACAEAGVPLFLEPIAYSLDPARALTNAERRQVVVANARHFTARGATVLKMEFPLDAATEPDERVWDAALRELDAACTVPWALLSGGTAFDVFVRQVDAACRAGACGVIAGRAVWAEAIALADDARRDFLATTGRARLRQLDDVCRTSAASWRDRTPPPDVRQRWYATESAPIAAR